MIILLLGSSLQIFDIITTILIKHNSSHRIWSYSLNQFNLCSHHLYLPCLRVSKVVTVKREYSKYLMKNESACYNILVRGRYVWPIQDLPMRTEWRDSFGVVLVGRKKRTSVFWNYHVNKAAAATTTTKREEFKQVIR